MISVLMSNKLHLYSYFLSQTVPQGASTWMESAQRPIWPCPVKQERARTGEPDSCPLAEHF